MGHNDRPSIESMAMAKEKRPEAATAIQRDIGNRIRWARELVEPNRAKMARLMGIDRSTLQKIEDGSRAPSVFNVLDLSHKLRVTPDYILKGSLRGIDGELAALLTERHPEILEHNRKAKGDDT